MSRTGDFFRAAEPRRRGWTNRENEGIELSTRINQWNGMIWSGFLSSKGHNEKDNFMAHNIFLHGSIIRRIVMVCVILFTLYCDTVAIGHNSPNYEQNALNLSWRIIGTGIYSKMNILGSYVIPVMVSECIRIRHSMTLSGCFFRIHYGNMLLNTIEWCIWPFIYYPQTLLW